jgi:hypothetical protein
MRAQRGRAGGVDLDGAAARSSSLWALSSVAHGRRHPPSVVL